MKRLILFALLLPVMMPGQRPGGVSLDSQNARRIQRRNVSATAPTYRQLLQWRGTTLPGVFTGAGLNDATSGGTYTGNVNAAFEVLIDGSVPSPDTFKWRKDGGAWTENVAITAGAAQALSDGVTVMFAAGDGHTVGNQWTIYVTTQWEPNIVAAGGAVGGADALPAADVIPRVSAAGVLGPSKFACTVSPMLCTFYDDTAVTGATQVIIRAGPGQAATDSFQLVDAAGTKGAWWNPASQTFNTYALTVVDAGSIYNDYNHLYGTSGYSANNFYLAGSEGAPDTVLTRTSRGRFQGNSGTTGKWGGFDIGTIALQSLATPTITSVTPSANNGVTCTYVLVARQGDNVATTAASAAVSTGAAGPTNCNSNTVVWTAAAADTYYQLSRTVGGTSQGLITAMAAWANNTTNCPAGTCTYIDTGSAAAGAAPTVNTTGQATIGAGGIMFATDGVGSIGAAAANRPGSINASYSITAPYITATGWYRALEIATDSGISDLLLHDTPRTGFGCLQFGGITNAFGALCRNGSGLKVRVASNDADTDLRLKRLIHTNGVEPGCATAADLVVDATDNTKISSATYTFVAADVPGRLQIISGAGWTPGDYTITSVAAGAALLDASPAPVKTASGVFTVNRGMEVFVEGTLGAAADTFRKCSADAAGAMAWRALF